MIDRRHNQLRLTNGFTLVELLVALAIVGLLTSIILVGMTGVAENSRVDRTRAQIARIHSLIAPKWEELHERRLKLPVFDPRTATDYRVSGGGRELARLRLDSRRELLSMALPDRKSDLVDGNFLLTTAPTEWRAMRRKAVRLIANHTGANVAGVNSPNAISTFLNTNWSVKHQNAECLYLILATMVDGDRSALEFFRQDEIGDADNDGIFEIHDGWGQPVQFLRWAPGLVAAGSYQTVEKPDPSDPLGIYAPFGTFQLFPVIFSGGPDKKLDIRTDAVPEDSTNESARIRYRAPYQLPNGLQVRNYPYLFLDSSSPINSPTQVLIGGLLDYPADGRDDSGDNIHNHFITTGR
ncbi:MAG: type II secretion system protein [Planctomycetales bacterium]|nr:type II secretion system protein [Planctomycetales bacterium]